MAVFEELRNELLEGGEISRPEALELIFLERPNDIDELVALAGEVTRFFHGREATLCSILNAKSGLCPEDCSFCAQSVKFNTGVKRHPLLETPAVIENAKRAEEIGSHEFCLVTSGAQLSPGEFERLLGILRELRKEVSLQLDVSIGFLTGEQAKQLKEAGVTRVNHNLQTSAQFYSEVVTTHSYSDRIRTLEALRAAGLEICSGVILGLGESRQDRIDAAFELRNFQPECVPINLLDPRPGTPLASNDLLDPLEIIKTIAVFRLILPRTNLRLAGGRRVQLGAFQKLALAAGINGLIVGKLLTTPGSPLEEDLENLKEAGFEVSARGERPS